MAGPYCQYCGHRCFVYRTLPNRLWSGHMATCAQGAAHDRARLGHDHSTAINPVAATHLVRALTATTGLTERAARDGLRAVLLAMTSFPVPAEMLESYATYLHAEMTHASDAR